MANKGSTSDLSLNIEGDIPNKQMHNSTLKFSNISLKAKQRDGNILKILDNVSGEFTSGRLSMILGPSGAGKTSFLNVLSGFKRTNVGGQISYNGKERNIESFRKISSYITQDFAMLDRLTTRETMIFAADMKLSRKISKADKMNVIEDILTLLNLQRCKNSYVIRLSGGERKRLSIAVELIANPPVMFFDEPTSGLDSVSSFQILTYLRKLAEGGRIVICVIHQPSSRLMNLFDDVLVLAEGCRIYNGNVNYMVEYFKKHALVCPSYYNPADFVLEVASGERGKESLSKVVQENLEKSCFVSSDEKIPNTEDCEKVPMITDKRFEETSSSSSYSGDINPNSNSRSFLENFFILTKRAFISSSRDKFFVQLRVLFHLFIGILIGIVFWDIGSELSKIFSNASCLFFFILFIFAANSMPNILTCPLETKVFLREHLNGWYSIESYFLSKLVADIPLQLICPTLFISIAYYLTGQPMVADRFFQTWLMALLLAVVAHAKGIMAGSAFSLHMAIFLVPASIIPMLLFAGFFIKIRELSVYLQPLTHISYFRYSIEGFSQAIYGNNRTDLVCSAPFCYYRTPKQFLQDMEMNGDERFMNDIIALIAWILFFNLCLYVALVIKVKRAQK